MPIPSVPSSVSAGAGTGINVSGKSSADATGFNIYRGASPTSLTLYDTVNASSGSAYLARDGSGNLLLQQYQDIYYFTHSTFGVTYYYALTATNASGESAQSPPVSATSVSPDPVGTVTGTAGVLSVSLSWSAAAHADYYAVYRSTDAPGFNGSPAYTTSPSYTDTSVTGGVTYFYIVEPFHDNPGTSFHNATTDFPGGYAQTTGFTPTLPPAPNAPASPAATAGNTTVALAWTASTTTATSPVIRYSVYMGTSTGAETTLVASNLTATSYTVTGLTNGTRYYFVIKATDRGSVSAASSEVNALPAAPPAPPAPTSLTESIAGGDLQVALSWAAASGVTTYQVLRGLAHLGPYSPVATVGATSYTDFGVVGGTTYFYVVESVGDGVTTSGDSVPSNEVSATPTAPPPPVPTAPQSLTAFPGVGDVVLHWSAPGNAGLTGSLTYSVYRGTTTGGESGTPIHTGTVGLTYTDSGLTAGTTYFYYVKAVGTSGTSVASNEASATPVAFSANKNNWANGSYPAISTFTAAPKIVDLTADDSTTGYTSS